MVGSPLPLTSHSEDGLPAAVFSQATRFAVPGSSRHAGPGNDWFGGHGRSGGGGPEGGKHATSAAAMTTTARTLRDPDRTRSRALVEGAETQKKRPSRPALDRHRPVACGAAQLLLICTEHARTCVP